MEEECKVEEEPTVERNLKRTRRETMVEALLQLAAAPPFAAHAPVQAGQQLPQLPAPVELGNVEQMEEECKVEEQKATDHSTEVCYEN